MHDADRDGDAPDPKRLRPGEIDPAPETKPARPDPVDMDEDELEMLQEARARLANTKGKKAKRKARERMLKEARRLASIQKRNELSAAGIKMSKRVYRSDTSVDYNAEIPFQIRQPIGFYDTFDEDKFSVDNKEVLDFRRLTSNKFEGDPNKEEALKRRKDIKRQKLYKEACLPDAIKELNKMNDPSVYTSRRENLVLPKPQVSNTDLENIARFYPENFSNTEKGPSGLLAAHETPATPLPARTPRTNDFRRQDIQDNIALTRGSNPLLGGESVQLHDPNFARKGIDLDKVKTSTAITPNVLVAAAMQKSGLTPGNTPYTQTPLPGTKSGNATPFTPGKTPLRDQLSLNTPSAAQHLSTPAANGPNLDASFPNIGLSSAKSQKKRRKKLKKSFVRLPKPRLSGSLNIVMPEISNPVAADEIEEDMDDIHDRKEKDIEKRKIIEDSLRSSTRKRNLPVPLALGESSKINGKRPKIEFDHSNQTELLNAVKMIENEYNSVLRTDIPNPKRIFKQSDKKYYDKAKELLEKECQKIASERKEKDETFIGDYITPKNGFENVDKDIFFLPRQRRFGFISRAAKNDQMQAFRQEFELVKNQALKMERVNERAGKKAALLIGGFERRAKKAVEEITGIFGGIKDKKRELCTFKQIYQRENFAIPIRHEALKNEVHVEMDREKKLQKEYEKLFSRYRQMISA